MIVRWGLGELRGLVVEAGGRPFVVASPRWQALELPFEIAGRWSEVPSDRLDDAGAEALGSNVLLAIGGGSAIDLVKALSSRLGLPVVSVPTTYSGAEWTPYFGIRSPERTKRGGGTGALLAGAVYDPTLTLSLPLGETVGTALNALAHCAEALYVHGKNAEGDREALEGAARIAQALPAVVAQADDLVARTLLLQGAMHAGKALAAAGLGLAHAMAQALGGRYGIAHGALNAVCLPAALEFNLPAAAGPIAAFGGALEGDPIVRTKELARLGGFARLRDLGVPRDGLAATAVEAAARPGAKANPRTASDEEIAALLASIW